MPERNIQQYYTDRRERGMTDAMIANEMEASGWALGDAQAAVQEARGLYAPSLTRGFVQTQEAVEYDVPVEYHQHSRWRNIVGLVYLGSTVVALLFLDLFENSFTLIVVVPTIIILCFGIVLIWKVNNRLQPRRIRIDAQGVTILVPHLTHYPWSRYESFTFDGHRQHGALPRRDELPLPVVTLPMFALHIRGKQGWITDRERREDEFPYPPLQRERLETFMKQYLPLRVGPRPHISNMSWKGVLAIVMVVVIVALWLYTAYLRFN